MAKHISIPKKIKRQISTHPVQHTHITHPEKYDIDSGSPIYYGFENITAVPDTPVVIPPTIITEMTTADEAELTPVEEQVNPLSEFEAEYQDFIANLKQANLKQNVINEITTSVSAAVENGNDIKELIINILDNYKIIQN